VGILGAAWHHMTTEDLHALARRVCMRAGVTFTRPVEDLWSVLHKFKKSVGFARFAAEMARAYPLARPEPWDTTTMAQAIHSSVQSI
jgi:hypothetical protein